MFTQIIFAVSTLCLPIVSQVQQQPSAPPKVACIVSNTDARADLLFAKIGKVNQKPYDSKELQVREIRINSSEILLVDESVFSESIGNSFGRLLNVLSNKGSGQILDVNSMDPSSKEALHSVLSRGPYNARFVKAYLDAESPKVGIFAFTKIVLTNGSKTCEVPIYLNSSSEMDAKVAEGGNTFEKVTKDADSTEMRDRTNREIEKSEPSKLVFRFMKYRNSLEMNSESLSTIGKLLSDEMKKEREKVQKQIEKLAGNWLSDRAGADAWPPKDGSDLASLDSSTRDLVEKAFQQHIGNFKFGSEGEANGFLASCKLTVGYTDLAVQFSNNSATTGASRYCKFYVLSGTRW
jgi:hypothetical protein